MFDKKTNIAAQEAFGEAVNSGSLEFDDLVALDVIDHDPAPGQAPGPQGYRGMFTELRTDFQGHPATGKSVDVRGMQIGRFADGKLAERWGSSDQLGIMTQLGLVDG